jgi:MerR family transcriptional regulator, light-induced transcriptional regulator
MAIYSIRDLEKLTGIKAHTIRIWEQRYHLITPARTETNIRYYTDENLRLLFNIALLNRNGLKISKLAKMRPDDIAAKGAELTQNKNSVNSQIEALTLSMIDMDESAFESVFNGYVNVHGFETTMVELIYPFLDKLRVLWLTNSINPTQEKFIGQLIRRKLMSTIDQLPSVSSKAGVEKILLYSPEGESQELALLFVQYLIRVRHIQAVYLGSGVTLTDLREACQMLRPEFTLTILQEPIPRQSIQSYVDHAAANINGGQLLLTGAQLFVSPVMLPSNARILNGLEETLNFLNNLTVKRK